MLVPILRGLAGNTKTVDRTVHCWDDLLWDPPCECMQIRLTGSTSQLPLQLICLKSPKTHITNWPVDIVGPDAILSWGHWWYQTGHAVSMYVRRWMVMVVVYRKSCSGKLASASVLQSE